MTHAELQQQETPQQQQTGKGKGALPTQGEGKGKGGSPTQGEGKGLLTKGDEKGGGAIYSFF
jgi:hypothetical protein